MKILGQVFGGLGVLLLFIAALIYLGEAAYLGRAKISNGTVVELYRSIDSEGGNSYCPVFQFKSSDGQTLSHRGNVCSSPPAYKVGDTVQLYYDPHNAKDAQLADFWSQYAGVVIVGGIGIVFLVAGLAGARLFGSQPGSRAGGFPLGRP